ncbi:hypothetical protein [Mesonia sp. K7]|uniref:hypothetical protein n=1 Tax=Mesonia sp. K7 TaxID=2218606 RepID=UPI000DA9CC17|nr:hypothetical protein [Mesonia sp. K7]PZD76465.1 hypothetical protein DNG35_11900 [Mesonia sp. K7]
MKTNFLSLIFACLLVVGCSSDDTNSGETNNANYMPLTDGNSWTYSNTRTVNDDPQPRSVNQQETLTANSSGQNQFTFTSNQPEDNQGLFTGVLSKGSLSKSGTKLLYTGTYTVNMQDLGFDPVDIDLENVVIFDANAGNNETLTTESGTINQTVDVQGQNIPFTINYTIATTQQEILNTYDVAGTIYDDVLVSALDVHLEVKADFGIASFDVLAEQNVLKSINYFGSDVGMIYSTNAINYEFEDLTAYGLMYIEPIEIQSTQSIESHIIN